MEYDILRAKELIAQREDIDTELKAIFSGAEKSASRKPQKCGTCGEEGHSTRTCPKRSAELLPQS